MAGAVPAVALLRSSQDWHNHWLRNPTGTAIGCSLCCRACHRGTGRRFAVGIQAFANAYRTSCAITSCNTMRYGAVTYVLHALIERNNIGKRTTCFCGKSKARHGAAFMAKPWRRVEDAYAACPAKVGCDKPVFNTICHQRLGGWRMRTTAAGIGTVIAVHY